MAEVFRATVGPDPETYAFDIALKRMHPHLEGDPRQVDMFMTEADVAKFLKHDNIVQVYEAGIIESHAYIAMEFVWGLDLSAVLLRLRQLRIRLPSDLAVFIVLQILRALDYVHRAVAPGGEPMDLVHRDVTPSNIYLTFDGQVKLADFGVARVSFIETHEESQTLKGKVAYMPPEVLAGYPVDPQVDLWSIAVTLYEMVTMRRMYEGVSEADLIAGTVAPTIVAAEKINRDIDTQLAKILRSALHRNRKRRPHEAVDFYRLLKGYLADQGVQTDQEALGRFLREAVGVAAPSASYSRPGVSSSDFVSSEYRAPIEMSPTQRLQLHARRRSWAWPAALALGLVLVLIVGYLILAPPESKEQAPIQPAANVDEATPPKAEPAEVQESSEAKEPVKRKRRRRRKKR